MEPMNKVHKRWIFWSLILSFFIYSFVVYTSGTEFPKNSKQFTSEAKLGKDTFQKYNCISCHQIFGLGGYMGPDLTNVISDEHRGENYAKAFLLTGTERMPNFQMSDTELGAIIAYLKYIGNTVEYPVKNSTTTWYGTIETKSDE